MLKCALVEIRVLEGAMAKEDAESPPSSIRPRHVASISTRHLPQGAQVARPKVLLQRPERSTRR